MKPSVKGYENMEGIKLDPKRKLWTSAPFVEVWHDANVDTETWEELNPLTPIKPFIGSPLTWYDRGDRVFPIEGRWFNPQRPKATQKYPLAVEMPVDQMPEWRQKFEEVLDGFENGAVPWHSHSSGGTCDDSYHASTLTGKMLVHGEQYIIIDDDGMPWAIRPSLRHYYVERLVEPSPEFAAVIERLWTKTIGAAQSESDK